jgi:hypothetical protein
MLVIGSRLERRHQFLLRRARVSLGEEDVMYKVTSRISRVKGWMLPNMRWKKMLCKRAEELISAVEKLK